MVQYNTVLSGNVRKWGQYSVGVFPGRNTKTLRPFCQVSVAGLCLPSKVRLVLSCFGFQLFSLVLPEDVIAISCLSETNPCLLVIMKLYACVRFLCMLVLGGRTQRL